MSGSVPDDARLPRSLYAETARERVATSPLDGDRTVDVAIVGGGFTGLSAALPLAQRGVEVAVLEAREPGWGASGRNGGQVNPGLKHEPDEIEAEFGAALGRRMIALSGDAPNRVFALIREHQIRCDARQTGTIRATFTNGSADTIRRATERWQRRGAPVELLDRDGIATATGTGRYICGALDRRGGSVNPLGYARGLAEAAIRAGASVHSQTPAAAVVRQGNKWLLTTPRGSVTAEWLVLATNGYTDDLWPGLRRSIVPVYSGIVATEPLPDAVARRILPEGSVLYEHEAITVYYRLDAANRLLMGGRSRLRPLEGPEGFRDLMRYTKRLWPFIGDVRWSHGWNGQLAITTDHYPHLQEPGPNAIACLGYNGRGIAMATVMGGEIARRISGTPASDLDMPVTPLRPIPFHRLWPLAASARIAYGRARNALGM
ncbi:NAD(P)/FAD-dependent oxidoreductase [Lichenifustis flavocetrariae]|uniref:FAD-binding oxidoreductase n=1 Tax=Lichenifustis flavocetrariae TaxID=2949735 RepID=A0AA41YY86_9HYPH|nr:FAD-binding oxidoreductase [Lichenifustis flavocetrariae]MCW6509510.1 FAD-binding oxidoreductase [Lichenifustis flavocetrariae]